MGPHSISPTKPTEVWARFDTPVSQVKREGWTAPKEILSKCLGVWAFLGQCSVRRLAGFGGSVAD